MNSKSKNGQDSKKDRTRNDKGKLLEQLVAMLHETEGVKVETNVLLPPKSGDQSRTREIDVLLTGNVAGYPVRLAIQCKNYGNPITVGQIGEFRDLLEDVGIPPQNGIIVSVNGYQAGGTKRAKELGIKALVFEGLDETRLKAEIKDTFQFFVHLLLVVEDMRIRSEIADGILAFSFWEEDDNIIGWFSDLIVSRWRNGEIPMKLGEYTIDLKLPQGWYQVLDGKLIYPENMTARVRVVGYLAEMKGTVEEFKLKDADTNEVEKFHLQANFDVLDNLIQSTHEEPILTEEELKTLQKNVTASIENRIRLPKIFVRNHLEPISKKAFDKLLEGTENVSTEDLAKLPQLAFEEVEGFGSMQEMAFLGEPVIIPIDSGELIDVRLLMRKAKFDEVIDLVTYLEKYPRPDFAEFLSTAFLFHGEALSKDLYRKNMGLRKFSKSEHLSVSIELSKSLQARSLLLTL